MSCHIGMGKHRGHLNRNHKTFYLEYPFIPIYLSFIDKDYSITQVLLILRIEKTLKLLKKHLIIWRGYFFEIPYTAKTLREDATGAQMKFASLRLRAPARKESRSDSLFFRILFYGKVLRIVIDFPCNMSFYERK